MSTPRYAAVHAAFVAGMSCMVGVDFGAKLLASLARAFEVNNFLIFSSLQIVLVSMNLLFIVHCIFYLLPKYW